MGLSPDHFRAYFLCTFFTLKYRCGAARKKKFSKREKERDGKGTDRDHTLMSLNCRDVNGERVRNGLRLVCVRRTLRSIPGRCDDGFATACVFTASPSLRHHDPVSTALPRALTVSVRAKAMDYEYTRPAPGAIRVRSPSAE